MSSIPYIKLYTYLLSQDGLSHMAAIRSIKRIRKLNPEIKAAVIEWFNGKNVNLEINGVSFNELVKDEGFSPIRAFFMMDWVLREPLQALHYLAIERMSPPAPPSEGFQQDLRDALMSEGKPVPSDILEDDQSDIVND